MTMMNRRTGLVGAGCALLLVVAGCVVPQIENEVTWGIKAAQERLTETTVKEWQSIIGVVDAAVPEVDITLTDEQAQGIIDFLNQYDLNSVDDIIAFIEDVENGDIDVEDIEIPESLMELFGDNQGLTADVLNNLGG